MDTVLTISICSAPMIILLGIGAIVEAVWYRE
jgi:hypothetical protein